MRREIKKDLLTVKIYSNRDEMGKAAALAATERIKKLQREKDEINIIFAAAPSQNEMLERLKNSKEIEWGKINAFHMDEYIGLSKDALQGFGNFLRDRLFNKVPFKNVYYIYSENETVEETCERYRKLLKDHPADIVCLGIGENGHIAFNDPGEADFQDKEIIKKVELDEVCRMQQVNDGCFEKIGDVPQYALTLTVPALIAASSLICTVPAKTKAQAVFNTINCEINEKVPATVMRRHSDAVMFCDIDSGGLIK